MSNYKTKKITPAPSAEEIKEQKVRALVQQRNALAQGALMSILQADGTKNTAGQNVLYAFEIADRFMDELYLPKEEPKSTL